MLTVDQYEYIRIGYRVYGKGIKQLRQETGHSRNTIRKVIREEFSDYKQRSNQPYPVLAPYMEIIDNWLKDDKEVHSKQRHTARRVYKRLVKEHNFEGSEPTVRKYVRESKAKLGLNGKQAFVPLSPEIGQEAEVDWGDVKVKLAGKTKTVKLFCIRSKYSGKLFAQIFPVERQQALFEGHIQAFSFFGGIFRYLIYDNLTTAIKKIFKGKNRQEQESFQRFRAYYNFEAKYCNPGEPHEKGGVEGIVGYVRRNFLVPIPEVESLEEVNQLLLEECIAYGNQVISGRTQSVDALFEQEEEYLLPLPDKPFENILSYRNKVNHYSTVLLDKNQYSVPVSYVGLRIDAALTVNEVNIYYDGKLIAIHKRRFSNNKWCLNPDHYLDLLAKRPGAFNNAIPIQEWRQTWSKNHEKLLAKLQNSQGENQGIKDFLNVLLLYREFDASDIETAIEKSLQAGISSGEAVRHFLISPKASDIPVSLEGWETLPQPDVSAYNHLGGEV